MVIPLPNLEEINAGVPLPSEYKTREFFSALIPGSAAARLPISVYPGFSPPSPKIFDSFSPAGPGANFQSLLSIPKQIVELPLLQHFAMLIHQRGAAVGDESSTAFDEAAQGVAFGFRHRDRLRQEHHLRVHLVERAVLQLFIRDEGVLVAIVFEQFDDRLS